LPWNVAKAHDMARADRPMIVTPRTNFIGVDGKRPARLVQIQPKTGASRTMASGLIDWNHSGLMVMPAVSLTVLSAAKIAILPAACSKIIQKSIAATNSGMYARSRERSRAVTFGERNITQNVATGAASAM